MQTHKVEYSVDYDLEEQQKKPHAACDLLRYDLKMCLLASDCCKVRILRLNKIEKKIFFVIYSLDIHQKNVYRMKNYVNLYQMNVDFYLIHFLNVNDRW